MSTIWVLISCSCNNNYFLIIQSPRAIIPFRRHFCRRSLRFVESLRIISNGLFGIYNMITILVIFCQLALSYVHSAPIDLGGCSSSSRPHHEAWLLREVWIRTELPDQPPEHHTRRVRLVRRDNSFYLDELRPDTEEADEDRRVFACFKDSDFYSYLDDTIYVVLQEVNRVIRMTLAKKNEAPSLRDYLVPTTPECMFSVMKKYRITLIVETTGLTALRSAESSDDRVRSTSLTLTVFAEMDPLGSGAGKRRFVIGGGERRQLFAVFNEGDFNFVRFMLNDYGTKRFEFVVKPPGNFWGKMHYFFTTTRYDDTADRLATEMRRYASEDINVPERNYTTTLNMTTTF